MQQEIENYESEIRDLKKKIPKKNLFNIQAGDENSPNANRNTIQPNSPGIFSSADSAVFAQEIKLVKTMNRMLEKSNVELKTNLTEVLMSKLPPLPKLVKQSSLLNRDENLTKLTKESNELMKNLYSSLAGVKVTELEAKKSVSYKAQNDVEFKYYRTSARKVKFLNFLIWLFDLLVNDSVFRSRRGWKRFRGT
jgi:hypothetical protein